MSLSATPKVSRKKRGSRRGRGSYTLKRDKKESQKSASSAFLGQLRRESIAIPHAIKPHVTLAELLDQLTSQWAENPAVMQREADVFLATIPYFSNNNDFCGALVDRGEAAAGLFHFWLHTHLMDSLADSSSSSSSSSAGGDALSPLVVQRVRDVFSVDVEQVLKQARELEMTHESWFQQMLSSINVRHDDEYGLLSFNSKAASNYLVNEAKISAPDVRKIGQYWLKDGWISCSEGMSADTWHVGAHWYTISRRGLHVMKTGDSAFSLDTRVRRQAKYLMDNVKTSPGDRCQFAFSSKSAVHQILKLIKEDNKHLALEILQQLMDENLVLRADGVPFGSIGKKDKLDMYVAPRGVAEVMMTKKLTESSNVIGGISPKNSSTLLKASSLMEKKNPGKCIVKIGMPDEMFASIVVAKTDTVFDALRKCCTKRGLDPDTQMLINSETGDMYSNSTLANSLQLSETVRMVEKPQELREKEKEENEAKAAQDEPLGKEDSSLRLICYEDSSESNTSEDTLDTESASQLADSSLSIEQAALKMNCTKCNAIHQIGGSVTVELCSGCDRLFCNSCSTLTTSTSGQQMLVCNDYCLPRLKDDGSSSTESSTGGSRRSRRGSTLKRREKPPLITRSASSDKFETVSRRRSMIWNNQKEQSNYFSDAEELVVPKSIWIENATADSVDIRKIHPTEFARQYTLLASRIYERITMAHLVKQAWRKRKNAVSELINLITDLSQWVASEVLTATFSSEFGMSHALQKMVRYGYEMALLRNYAGVFAIVHGIKKHQVSRLEDLLWPLLRKDKTTMEQWQLLEEITSPEKNYAAYRELIHGTERSIPYPGIVCQDITMIDDGNETFGDDARTSINKEKLFLVFKAMEGFLAFKGMKYRLALVEPFREWYHSYRLILSDEQLDLQSSKMRKRGEHL